MHSFQEPIPVDNQIMQSFQKLLVNENEAFIELSELLSLERNALEQQDIDKIIHFSEKKQQITKRLENLSQQRTFIIDQLGLIFHSEQGTFEPHLSEPLQGLWDSILNKVENCHIKNQINGKIISNNQSSVARSLRLLKSQSRDLGMTYTSKGQTHSRTSSINGLKA